MHTSFTRCDSPSVSVSSSQSWTHPAQRLLRLVNPKSRPTIHLDDLVRTMQRQLLKAVPITARDQVRIAMERFIVEKRSFKITSDQFMEFVSQVPSVGASPVRKVGVIPNVQIRLAPNCSSSQESDNPSAPHTPIPKRLQARIRTLSQERQFITYDGDLNVQSFKLSSQQKREAMCGVGQERRHRRTVSNVVTVSEMPDRIFSYAHTRTHSKTRSDVEGKQRDANRRSPESHVKTGDTSFVGSSATTPKQGSPLRLFPSPPESKMPSLKDGIDKLLQVRQRYWEMSKNCE